MAVKSANVAVRVEPEIKYQAEKIMSQLGLSASTAINMFYRQIIMWNGMPFRPSIPEQKLMALEEMDKEEFDARMALGLAQAKGDMSRSADDVFNALLLELGANENE